MHNVYPKPEGVSVYLLVGSFSSPHFRRNFYTLDNIDQDLNLIFMF